MSAGIFPAPVCGITPAAVLVAAATLRGLSLRPAPLSGASTTRSASILPPLALVPSPSSAAATTLISNANLVPSPLPLMVD